MAESYSISYTATSITFTFNTTKAYYLRCFIRTPNYDDILDVWVGYHEPGYTYTYSGLTASTKYVCNAQYSLLDGSDGTWLGAIEFTTRSQPGSTVLTRPAKFEWENSIVVQGKDAIVYASDWNALTENINEVRAYRKGNGYTVSGNAQYTFTTAVENNYFTADIYNEAVNAIKEISGYGTYLSEVSKGDAVSADLLRDLASAINSVP